MPPSQETITEQGYYDFEQHRRDKIKSIARLAAVTALVLGGAGGLLTNVDGVNIFKESSEPQRDQIVNLAEFGALATAGFIAAKGQNKK